LSRQHNAEIRATSIEVCLICDECEKEEWVPVPLPLYCDESAEYKVVTREDNDWVYADDALVCSEKCERDFWEWPPRLDGPEF